MRKTDEMSLHPVAYDQHIFVLILSLLSILTVHLYRLYIIYYSFKGIKWERA